MTWANLEGNRIKEIAEFLKQKAPSASYDFRHERPDIEDIDLLANYVGSIVALDYGFWRQHKGKFEADFYEWRGERLKGASFLWVKSKLIVEKDPTFFTAGKLGNLSLENFNYWLKDDSGRVPFKDPQMRFSLISDFGNRLLKVQSLHQVYKKVKGNLKAFVYFMEDFEAYSDFPFFKKAHLLCKIMERMGKWQMREDSDFKKVPPIDYHLMNMAWKLGLIVLPQLTEQNLINYRVLGPGHEFIIRSACMEAYRQLIGHSGLDPYKIDEIMWTESRTNCQKEPYTCSECLFYSTCPRNKVGFPIVETYRY